jgi:hypothetical protein
MGLSGDALVFALTVAGSALALWLLVRFPGFGPRTVLGATLHVAAAFACGYAIGPATQLIAALPVPETRLLALLVGAFPPLVYLLLSIGWLFRAIQRGVGVYS